MKSNEINIIALNLKTQMDSIQALEKQQKWMEVLRMLVLVFKLIQQLISNAIPSELMNSKNKSFNKLNILLDKVLICMQLSINFNFQRLQLQFFTFHLYFVCFLYYYFSTGYLELPTSQINQYKKKSNADALIEEVLLDKFLPPNSITPLIFTKKLPQGGQYRFKGTQPLWVNALESLLSVVVQLYYKSDQKLAEFMKDKGLVDSKKELKQEKKPGRKKKILDNDSPNQEQTEQQQQQSTNNNVYSLLQQDVLDILISPLRNDFPFETWTPKEIAIFECGLCRYGKQYEFLSHLIKTKNAQDIIQFYYFWKFTSHYKLWKINKAYYHRSNLNNYV